MVRCDFAGGSCSVRPLEIIYQDGDGVMKKPKANDALETARLEGAHRERELIKQMYVLKMRFGYTSEEAFKAAVSEQRGQS